MSRSKRRNRKKRSPNEQTTSDAPANQSNQSKSGKQGKSGQANNGRKRANGGKAGKGKQPPAPKLNLAEFWGDHEDLPAPRGYQVQSDDPTAILRSLGRPPIPGNETAAEHHFTMVYQRSVGLAIALAAAGGLDQEADDD